MRPCGLTTVLVDLSGEGRQVHLGCLYEQPSYSNTTSTPMTDGGLCRHTACGPAGPAWQHPSAAEAARRQAAGDAPQC
jgi:hypothetical protein